MTPPKPGTVGWFDLTIENADQVKDFYSNVVGWKTTGLDLGGYNDYCMHPEEGSDPIAGICHAKGSNADLPPQWLMYITVENIQTSLTECTNHGGEIIRGAKAMEGYGTMAVIKDPAGAVCALFQPEQS